MQSPAPSEYFENIKFNYSFYTTGDAKVTLEYVNNNFLKCTGYAYSRAISTSFNGIIYALGGIETTDITASGTISANLFQGSGTELSNLNASNISAGTLAVNRGGTGSSTLALGQLLIGNDTNPITQSANLIWDITNNNLGIGKNPAQKLDVNGTIAATLFSGSGASLTGLTEGQIPVLTTAKIPFLPQSRITGLEEFVGIITSVTNALGTGEGISNLDAVKLTGTINNARLPAAISVTSLAGDGASLTNLNATNIATGTINNARLPAAISVTSFTGDGANITAINAAKITTGTIDNDRIALTTTKVFQHFNDKTFAVIDEKIDIPPTYSFNITSYDNPYLYGPSIDKKFKGKINASYDDRYGVYKLVSTDITKTNNTMVLNYKVGDKISIRNLADTKNDYILDGNFKYYMSMVLYKRPSNLFWVNYPDTNFIQMIEWKSTSGTYPMLDPYLIDYRSGTEVNYPISTIISFTMEAGWSYYLMRFWIEITNPLPLIYPLGTEQNDYNQVFGGGQTFKFQSGTISLNTNYVPAFSYTGPAYTTATSFQPGLVKPKFRMSVDDEGGISADAPTATEIYGKLNASHFINNVATGKIDISTNLAELKGPKGDTGKGWKTGSAYNSTNGIVSFLSDDGLGFDTADIRGGKGDKGDKGDNGDNGTNGKGWTGATYSATTGKVSFTSTDGTPFVFDTGDLRGGVGATGKGWTDASYNATTGIVTFASNDALGFTTGNLKGTNGTNGTNGKGWTGATYNATTGKVSFASSDGTPYVFDTGDLRGGAGANGKGWTSGSYNATTGIVSFASNDAGYAFTTGDLRGGAGANGKGWTGGSYNATTGIVSFASNDAGYAFTTGDLRGAAGSDATNIWLKNTVDTTKIYYNTGRVGIGTTDPQYNLDIQGTSPVSLHMLSPAQGSSWIRYREDIDLGFDVGYAGGGNRYAIFSYNLSPTGVEHFSIGRGVGRITMGMGATGTVATLSRLKVYGYLTETLLAEFTLASGASGVNIGNNYIATAGTDANISLNIQSKGTGGIFLQAPAGTTRITINGSTGGVSMAGTLSAGATTITGNSSVIGNLAIGTATAQLSITGNSINAQGSDANIPITIKTKGTSSFGILTGATPTTRLSISELGSVTIGGGISSGSITSSGTVTVGPITAFTRMSAGSIFVEGNDVSIPLSIATKGVGDLTLRTNATTRLTINSAGLATFANDISVAGNHTQTGTSTLTGRVGIGTAPHATYACDINGTLNATSVLVNGGAISGSKWTTGTPSTNIYYSAGNVAIGTTDTSTYRLNVSGNTYISGQLTTGGGLNVGSIGATSISASSLASSGYIQGGGTANTWRITANDGWIRLRDPGETTHKDFAAGRLYAHNELDVQGAAIFNNTLTVNNTTTLNNLLYVNSQILSYFYSVSRTNTDYLCVQGGTFEGEYYQNWIRIAFLSFTEFHRCYTNDILYNTESSSEFKKNYMGRVVIATGKIKTDSTDNAEESGPYKDNIKPEWISRENKEGISIEDAIPIVQLSRKKKDKRVFGVLGEPTRSTNNKDRLIVNSVGEGAICVSNTNGNIENGDYIQSSDILGYGEKQDDDLLHNYTIAKSTIDCNFELDSPYYQCHEIENGVRVAFIACTYHCG